MDPLTQGVLGASLPQAMASRRDAVKAGILGFLAGMAPDLDILIRSSTDPLLFLEFHRQFTHALVFIPFGGLLCALVLHALLGRRWQLSFRLTLLFCTLGYATHALLDACTTYGTMLLWPFSDARIAWNTVSVIDPVFTLPVVFLVLFAGLRRQPALARLALVWAVVYLSLGLWNRNTAVELGQSLAESRGHSPVRLEAKPSFANILVWKIVYETQGRFYVDAVRVGFNSRIFAGDSVAKLDVARDLPWLAPDSQQARDIERFRWFSNGYIASDPDNANRVIDIRYSMVPNKVDALWSIELLPGVSGDQHARYLTHRDPREESASILWAMMKGKGGLAPEHFLGGG
jgi:inner membrane protein